MANGITSEWHDIHVKLGNYIDDPKQPKQSELNQKAQEKIEKLVQEKGQKKEDDIDDDFKDDNDEYSKQYMAKRIQEINEFKKKPCFGTVIEISRNEYISQVNEAPEECWVILHLYQDYNEKSSLLNNILNQLAAKYLQVKFIKIVATKCVESFPDSNVPALFIYKAGKMQQQLTNFDKFFKNFTYQEVEKYFHKLKIIHNDDLDDQDEEIQQYRNLLKQPFKKNDKEDVDSDDDREYTSSQVKQYKQQFM